MLRDHSGAPWVQLAEPAACRARCSCSWTEAMIIAEGQSLNHLEALAGAVYYQIRQRLKTLQTDGQAHSPTRLPR